MVPIPVILNIPVQLHFIKSCQPSFDHWDLTDLGGGMGDFGLIIDLDFLMGLVGNGFNTGKTGPFLASFRNATT
nr:hypothetical protein [uncultured Winogradskyella sp.]